jgi:hypothetical protein
LEETFLLQMNDFDRLLEIKLRQMLDPVARINPPRRGGRKRGRKPVLALQAPLDIAAIGGAVAEAIPVVDTSLMVVAPVALTPSAP